FIYEVPIPENNCTSYNILKLPYIPRPLICQEKVGDFSRDMQKFFLELKTVFVKKVVDQKRNITLSFS
ncbi:MAG: hypothetical protein K8R45_06245, partial [Desulfobacterales bacterium]|nr:hypothetical protein [Desulfobacterales bacterium]